MWNKQWRLGRLVTTFSSPIAKSPRIFYRESLILLSSSCADIELWRFCCGGRSFGRGSLCLGRGRAVHQVCRFCHLTVYCLRFCRFVKLCWRLVWITLLRGIHCTCHFVIRGRIGMNLLQSQIERGSQSRLFLQWVGCAVNQTIRYYHQLSLQGFWCQCFKSDCLLPIRFVWASQRWYLDERKTMSPQFAVIGAGCEHCP